MAATPSTMLPLGSAAPPFTLPDPSGKAVSIDDLDGPAGLLVMFICNHCPFVVHVRKELAALGRDAQQQGVAVVGISSNDVTTHPDDSPERMGEHAERYGYTFPYLFDESQDVAKAYRAACTPDFYLFDGDRKLVYRGQLDDSRPGNGVAVTGQDLRGAIDALVAGQVISEEQKPSIGCNIKWKPGNSPDYYGS